MIRWPHSRLVTLAHELWNLLSLLVQGDLMEQMPTTAPLHSAWDRPETDFCGPYNVHGRVML